VQEIADWLKKLGMSEYADRFAENKIEFIGARRDLGVRRSGRDDVNT
jgi:hypothetical protein